MYLSHTIKNHCVLQLATVSSIIRSWEFRTNASRMYPHSGLAEKNKTIEMKYLQQLIPLLLAQIIPIINWVNACFYQDSISYNFVYEK